MKIPPVDETLAVATIVPVGGQRYLLDPKDDITEFEREGLNLMWATGYGDALQGIVDKHGLHRHFERLME